MLCTYLFLLTANPNIFATHLPWCSFSFCDTDHFFTYDINLNDVTWNRANLISLLCYGGNIKSWRVISAKRWQTVIPKKSDQCQLFLSTFGAPLLYNSILYNIFTDLDENWYDLPCLCCIAKKVDWLRISCLLPKFSFLLSCKNNCNAS